MPLHGRTLVSMAGSTRGTVRLALRSDYPRHPRHAQLSEHAQCTALPSVAMRSGFQVRPPFHAMDQGRDKKDHGRRGRRMDKPSETTRANFKLKYASLRGPRRIECAAGGMKP